MEFAPVVRHGVGGPKPAPAGVFVCQGAIVQGSTARRVALPESR